MNSAVNYIYGYKAGSYPVNKFRNSADVNFWTLNVKFIYNSFYKNLCNAGSVLSLDQNYMAEWAEVYRFLHDKIKKKCGKKLSVKNELFLSFNFWCAFIWL